MRHTSCKQRKILHSGHARARAVATRYRHHSKLLFPASRKVPALSNHITDQPMERRTLAGPNGVLVARSGDESGEQG